MKRSLTIWQAVGLTFTVVCGTLLHFLFDWTGVKFFAAFSATNESTWEHMKLLFIPSFFFGVIQFAFFKTDYEEFWWVKLIGILIGVVSIPILFYTLGGCFGKLPGIVNILIFFVAVAVEYFAEWRLMKNGVVLKKGFLVPFLIILFVLVCFFVFTFYPPKISLFLDPVTNSYGF